MSKDDYIIYEMPGDGRTKGKLGLCWPSTYPSRPQNQMRKHYDMPKNSGIEGVHFWKLYEFRDTYRNAIRFERDMQIKHGYPVDGRFKKYSEDSKKRMSKAQSGDNHPFYGKHHSSGTIDKMREANPNKRECFIKGVRYSSQKEASRLLNIDHSTLRHRCDSPNFPDWIR